MSDRAGSRRHVAAAGRVAELRGPLATHRIAVLVSVLGAFEILMAASAGPTATVVVGVVGGAVLLATPWLTTRRFTASLLLLLIGTVPFAVLTWWSLVTPLLAVVALVLGTVSAAASGGTTPQHG